MRLIPLIFLTSLLSGCFIGPVEDFVDQMDDQYFADEFNNIPTEIKPYEKKASIELIWENKVGDNDAHNLNLIFSEEFVIAATSDGSLRKMQMATGETVWEKEISEEIMIGVGGILKIFCLLRKTAIFGALIVKVMQFGKYLLMVRF